MLVSFSDAPAAQVPPAEPASETAVSSNRGCSWALAGLTLSGALVLAFAFSNAGLTEEFLDFASVVTSATVGFIGNSPSGREESPGPPEGAATLAVVPDADDEEPLDQSSDARPEERTDNGAGAGASSGPGATEWTYSWGGSPSQRDEAANEADLTIVWCSNDKVAGQAAEREVVAYAAEPAPADAAAGSVAGDASGEATGTQAETSAQQSGTDAELAADGPTDPPGGGSEGSMTSGEENATAAEDATPETADTPADNEELQTQTGEKTEENSETPSDLPDPKASSPLNEEYDSAPGDESNLSLNDSLSAAGGGSSVESPPNLTDEESRFGAAAPGGINSTINFTRQNETAPEGDLQGKEDTSVNDDACSIPNPGNSPEDHRPREPRLVGIAIQHSEVDLAPEATHSFAVNSLDESGVQRAVSAYWSATCGTIGKRDGTYVAPTKSGETCTVIATHENYAANATVAVIGGRLARIAIEPSRLTSAPGAHHTLVARGYDANDNIVPLWATWWSSCGTIQPHDGTYVAPTRSGDSCTIGVAHQNFTANATVDVIAGPLAAITVEPSALTTPPGAHHGFRAQGYDSHGNSVPVQPTWTASCGNVDPHNGTYAAPTTAGARCGIAANQQDVNGTAVVAVVAGPPVRVVAASNATTLAAGERIALAVHGLDAHSNVLPIEATWSATCGTLSGNGTYTAPIKAGETCTIRATRGELTATVAVSTVPGLATHMEVVAAPGSIGRETTHTFEARAYDQHSNAVPSGFSWSATCGKIAVRNGTYVASANAGETCTITATMSNRTASANISIVEPPPQAASPAAPHSAEHGGRGSDSARISLAGGGEGETFSSESTLRTSGAPPSSGEKTNADTSSQPRLESPCTYGPAIEQALKAIEPFDEISSAAGHKDADKLRRLTHGLQLGDIAAKTCDGLFAGATRAVVHVAEGLAGHRILVSCVTLAGAAVLVVGPVVADGPIPVGDMVALRFTPIAAGLALNCFMGLSEVVFGFIRWIESRANEAHEHYVSSSGTNQQDSQPERSGDRSQRTGDGSNSCECSIERRPAPMPKPNPAPPSEPMSERPSNSCMCTPVNSKPPTLLQSLFDGASKVLSGISKAFFGTKPQGSPTPKASPSNSSKNVSSSTSSRGRR